MPKAVYRSEEGRSLVEGYYRDALRAAPAGLCESRYIEGVGGRTHVLVAGDENKPPLVLLHGSCSSSACWLGILEDYGRAFRLYCVDIPGEPGLSEAPRLPDRVDAASLWLESVLDGLGLPAVSFLGMSLGSWYALCLATRRPGRARALALITTAGIAPERRSFLFKAVLYSMQGAAGKEKLTRLVYHKAEAPSRVLEYQDLISAHFIPRTGRMPLFTDAELSALSMPLLYLGGDKDALVDTMRTAKRLRALVRHADLRVLPDTGHAIIDRFGEVREFLVSHAAGL